MKGWLTCCCYKYATIFVDQFSRFTYVNLQQTLTSEETIEAKEAYKHKVRKMGVCIEHYHADNGRFPDNFFCSHVKSSGQSLTFCCVNDHWKNGVAKKAICDVKDSASIMLLHAINQWPGALSVYLWPYTLQHAENVWNSTPFKDQELSPVKIFANSNTQPNLQHIHTFSCPVYILNPSLWAKQPIQTWLPRSRLGIYVGKSNQHAHSVSLILSLVTGLVSL